MFNSKFNYSLACLMAMTMVLAAGCADETADSTPILAEDMASGDMTTSDATVEEDASADSGTTDASTEEVSEDMGGGSDADAGTSGDMATTDMVFHEMGFDAAADATASDAGSADMATGDVAPEDVTEPATVVEVSMEGMAYVPADITVEVGTIVRWTNNDSMLHTVETAEIDFGGGIIIMSGDIAPGESWEMEFTEPGLMWGYRCAYHPTTMLGTVTVLDEEVLDGGGD